MSKTSISVIFQEHSEPGVCSNCEMTITKGYECIVQIGDAEDLLLKSLNYTLCENCYLLSQSG